MSTVSSQPEPSPTFSNVPVSQTFSSAPSTFSGVQPKAVKGGYMYPQTLNHNGEKLEVNVFVSDKLQKKLSANGNLETHLEGVKDKLVATWDVAKENISPDHGAVTSIMLKGKKAEVWTDGGSKILKDFAKVEMKNTERKNTEKTDRLEALQYTPKALVKQKVSREKIMNAGRSESLSSTTSSRSSTSSSSSSSERTAKSISDEVDKLGPLSLHTVGASEIEVWGSLGFQDNTGKSFEMPQPRIPLPGESTVEEPSISRSDEDLSDFMESLSNSPAAQPGVGSAAQANDFDDLLAELQGNSEVASSTEEADLPEEFDELTDLSNRAHENIQKGADLSGLDDIFK